MRVLWAGCVVSTSAQPPPYCPAAQRCRRLPATCLITRRRGARRAGGVHVLEKPSGLATQDVPARLNALLGRSACAPVWLPHRLDKYTQGLQVTSRGA
jgi:hypothetical protein